jgi:hypothetical protein
VTAALAPAPELVAALRAIVDDLDAGRQLAPSAAETIDAAADLIEVEL